MEMKIAAVHLFFKLGVWYLIVPTMPQIRPAIGTRKEQTSAAVAKPVFSPGAILGAEVLLCALFPLTRQPQDGQTNASSKISFPHFVQNFIIPPLEALMDFL